MNCLAEELGRLEQQGLRRRMRVAEPGRGLLNFSSNDYLGLSHHPAVKAGAAEAVSRYGCGATASRLMAGNLDLHAEAEERLAGWLGCEAALIYGSGFLTNLGVIAALADEQTVIFEDRLNHASLIDGARLCGGRLVRYRHADCHHLAELLQRHADAPRRIVVTDAVFSMDGDVAPLADLARLCAAEGAWWIVDEAHSLGVFGVHGRGCCHQADVRPTVLVGTFSKAFGSYGGFAATDAVTRDFLVNRSRTFIYSTGLAPACVGAALAALDLFQSQETPGARLLDAAARFRETLQQGGIDTRPSASPIIPVLAGTNERALAWAAALEAENIRTTAIRPPTVPANTARLRLSLTAGHTDEQLEQVAKALVRTRPAEHARPAAGPGGTATLAAAGHPPAALLAGGWMFGTEIWDPLAEQLPGWSLERLDWQKAMDAAEWDRRLDAAPAPLLLVGWSLSTLAALAAAARRPEAVAGLVLLSATARLPADDGYEGVPPAAVRAMRGRLRREAGAGYRDFLAACHAPATPESAAAEAWLAAAANVPAEAAMAGLGFLLDSDVRTLVPAIRAPTLLLHGSRDAVVPPSQSRWLASRLRTARRVELEYGHLPMSDTWSAAAAWMRERAGRGSGPQ